MSMDDPARLWQGALQALLLQHVPFHPSETEDFKELTRQFAGLEQMFLEQEKLRSYYAGCMQIACANAKPSDPCDTVHAAAMQLQLMEDAYFSLRLYQYANAPDNRGWMNLFRAWGRYGVFKAHVKQLAPNYSSGFIQFYQDYIEDWPSIDSYPIPHVWDLGGVVPEYEQPPLEELLPEEIAVIKARDKRVAPPSGVTPQAVEKIMAMQAERQVQGVCLDRGRAQSAAPYGPAAVPKAQAPPVREREHGEAPKEPPGEPR